MKFKKFFFSLCFLFLGLSTICTAGTQAEIWRDVEMTDEVPLSYLEDPHGEYTIEQIRDSVFTPLSEKVPNLGVSHSVYWIKFEVKTEEGVGDLLMLLENPSLDYVELFWEDGNHFSSSVVTELLPFNVREIDSPFPVFRLPARSGTTTTYWFKTWSKEQIQLPVSIGQEAAIFEKLSFTVLWVGIYIGIILLMVLYNFFVFVVVRDKSYMYYVLFILSVGFAQVITQGVQFQYLHPNFPKLAEYGFFIFPALAGATGLIFQRVFLQTSEELPKMAKLVYLFIGVYALSSFIGITTDHVLGYNIMQYTAMVVSVYLLAVSITLVRRGKREARFFLVAWTFFLLGIILFVLKDNNVVPYNFFTRNSMQIGSALEVILLSIALADKINTFKKEREESREKALEALHENERIIREQNVLLEEKVKERTVELEESNTELMGTLSELKQTQVQLVDAEKMASLGQMTAGIAHELNNPINFVSGNINPLRRDIEDLFEVLNRYEDLKETDDIKMKMEEIDELREELEIDFVRKEVDLLLKGIDEGAKRTSEIVRGLRVFSRLDEGELKLADINECLESTLVIVRSHQKGVCNFETEYDEDLRPINCFPGKINQVFMNIITNAVQAMAKSHKSPMERVLLVKTFRKDDNLVVSIKDNGIGIPENIKASIFDPFFTTKEVGEGTGLGLSIVLGIINDHEGNIEVISAPGEGTEFVITLPMNLIIV